MICIYIKQKGVRTARGGDGLPYQRRAISRLHARIFCQPCHGFSRLLLSNGIDGPSIMAAHVRSCIGRKQRAGILAGSTGIGATMPTPPLTSIMISGYTKNLLCF